MVTNNDNVRIEIEMIGQEVTFNILNKKTGAAFNFTLSYEDAGKLYETIEDEIYDESYRSSYLIKRNEDLEYRLDNLSDDYQSLAESYSSIPWYHRNH